MEGSRLQRSMSSQEWARTVLSDLCQDHSGGGCGRPKWERERGGQRYPQLPAALLLSSPLHPQGTIADKADEIWLDLSERSVCPSSLTHLLLPSSPICCRPVSFPETPYTASPAGVDKAPPYRQPSGSFSTPGSATYARYKPSPERSESPLFSN